MIYQHPLAYLLGLQGVALLRAFSGGYERDFTLARFAEIRALLDSAELGDGVGPSPLIGEGGTDLHDGTASPEHVPGEPPNIWALHPFCIAATNAAWRGTPGAIIWDFQLSAD